jgi:hypothetical protein
VSGDPMRVTKALYLLPHLMNILASLGATPAARDEILSAAPAAPSKTAPQETDLERFRRERGLA